MIVIINGNKVTCPAGPSTQMTGEKIPGDLKTWDYFGTDPNTLLAYSYDILSQRSTTLYHTHPPVAAAVNKMTAYGIGSGLVFRSQPDWQTLGITKEAAKDWGMRFQRLIHYAFLALNYYEKQSTLFRSAMVMGDSLLMFDRAAPVPGLPFDLVEVGGDSINFEAVAKSEGELVTLGIVHDQLLRRLGLYQVGNPARVNFRDDNGDQTVVQFYYKLIARQLRGYPLAYRIIAAAKNNDRFWDATLHRAVMETLILGSVESETDSAYKQMTELADSMKGDSEANIGSTYSTTQATNIGAGNILTFQKGGVKFTDLKTPSNNFDKMHAAYIEMVGMATDVPPECVLSKYSTSYTAHMGARNDFIKSYTQKRQAFARTVNNVAVFEIAKFLFYSRMIEMPHPDFFSNPFIQLATIAGNWLGPIPGQINPLDEVNARALEVENAFRTRADATADYGNEFDDMIEEWWQQEQEWRSKSPAQQATALVADEERDEGGTDEDPDADR